MWAVNRSIGEFARSVGPVPRGRLHLVLIAVNKEIEQGFVLRGQCQMETESTEFLEHPPAAGCDFTDRHEFLRDSQLRDGCHDQTPEPVATSSSFAFRFRPKLSSVWSVGCSCVSP